jgi:hypothetical protein
LSNWQPLMGAQGTKREYRSIARTTASPPAIGSPRAPLWIRWQLCQPRSDQRLRVLPLRSGVYRGRQGMPGWDLRHARPRAMAARSFLVRRSVQRMSGSAPMAASPRAIPATIVGSSRARRSASIREPVSPTLPYYVSLILAKSEPANPTPKSRVPPTSVAAAMRSSPPPMVSPASANPCRSRLRGCSSSLRGPCFWASRNCERAANPDSASTTCALEALSRWRPSAGRIDSRWLRGDRRHACG